MQSIGGLINSNHNVFGKLRELSPNHHVYLQAKPLEQVVLGAMMLDCDCIGIVLENLKNEHFFYFPAHQKIFPAIISLHERMLPIDLLTVTEELHKREDLISVGGPAYLSSLTNQVASAANIEYHCRIIVQYAIRRFVFMLGQKMIRLSNDEQFDPFELLDLVGEKYDDLMNLLTNKQQTNLGDLAAKALKNIEIAAKSKTGITGVPTGFKGFDKLTAGLQPSDFIIIAARPSVGKTSLAIIIAKNVALMFNQAVAIFTLEMSAIQYMYRLMGMESKVSSSAIRSGNLIEEEWQRMTDVAELFSNLPIFIDDTPGISIFELRAKARRLKMKHDIKVIIVDYLQLMTGGKEYKGNREAEVSAISRGLKSLAKELCIPVIALSQLTRSVEDNKECRPQLRHLRESGSLEQDADLVTFVYRPEVHNILVDNDGFSNKGKAEWIVKKHRNGELSNIPIRFVEEFAEFVDPDVFDMPPLPSEEPINIELIEDNSQNSIHFLT